MCESLINRITKWESQIPHMNGESMGKKSLIDSVINKTFVLTWGGFRVDGLESPPLMRGVRHELDDEGGTDRGNGWGHGGSAVPAYFRCIVVVTLKHRDVVIGAVVVVVFKVHVQEGQGYAVAWKTVQSDRWRWFIGWLINNMVNIWPFGWFGDRLIG